MMDEESDTTTYLSLSVFSRLDHVRLVHNSRDKSYTSVSVRKSQRGVPSVEAQFHARTCIPAWRHKWVAFHDRPILASKYHGIFSKFYSCLCTKRIANVESYRNVRCTFVHPRETDYPTAEGSSIKRKNSCRNSVRLCAMTE